MANIDNIESYCAHDWIISLTAQEEGDKLDTIILSALSSMLPSANVCIFVDKEFAKKKHYTPINRNQCSIELNETETQFILTKLAHRKTAVTHFRDQDVSIIPIYHQAQLLGFALVFLHISADIANTLSKLLNIYSNQLSMIHINMQDPFTGLYNRQTFDKKLLEIVSGNGFLEPRECNTGQRNWFLAMIDIDHFKRVNDSFGHTIGDEVILLVAQILKRSVRSQDYVFRYGGEEFAILFCGTSLTEATQVLERIRLEIKRYNFPQVGKVSVSIGLTEFRIGDSPKQFIEHADRALYQSKDQGRDRLTILTSGNDDFTGSIELF